MGNAEPHAAATAPGRRWNDLGLRAASGLVLLAIAVGSTQVGGLTFVLVWFVAAGAVLWEWLRLPGRSVPGVTLVLGWVGLVIVVILARTEPGEATVALLVVTVLQALLGDPEARLWIAGGQLYAGSLLLAVLALRFSVPFGAHSIIWLFAVVWSTDVFAYFGGRLIGGPKLWPAISPSKTWAGTVSGVAAGALIGSFVAARDIAAPPAVAHIFILSLVTAMLSQAGDAFESGLKRRFGVKDSGRLIPGHGGVMDRLDGFIAAAVFAFAIGWARDLASAARGLFYWP